MAYLEFNSEDNSIKAYRGLFYFYEKYSEKEVNEFYSELYHTEEGFKGIRINNFLSDLELKGHKAEIAFKDLLENNNLPFLYIGQGPYGVEKSNVLKEKTKSKRPDFLVNLPNMGTIFFDVKCRKKIGFPNNKKSYFQLFIKDIDGLFNLHRQILIPVWIAFINESEIKRDPSERTFYLVPISLLNKFKDELFLKLTERERNSVASLRIPYELLSEIKSQLTFQVGISDYEEDLVNTFYTHYKGFIRRIEDEIKESIRNNKLYKTTAASFIKDKKIEFAFLPEIKHILVKLIEEQTIIYKANEPLKLLGE